MSVGRGVCAARRSIARPNLSRDTRPCNRIRTTDQCRANRHAMGEEAHEGERRTQVNAAQVNAEVDSRLMSDGPAIAPAVGRRQARVEASSSGTPRPLVATHLAADDAARPGCPRPQEPLPTTHSDQERRTPAPFARPGATHPGRRSMTEARRPTGDANSSPRPRPTIFLGSPGSGGGCDGSATTLSPGSERATAE